MSDIVKRLLSEPIPQADGLLSEILREDAAAEIERLGILYEQWKMAAETLQRQQDGLRAIVIEQCAQIADKHGKFTVAAAIRALKDKPNVDA